MNRSDNEQDNTTHPNHLSVWPLPFAMCILAIIAETALIHSFIVSDFTLSIAANYSHSSTPMLYRIGAAFIPDSGAMLLWVTASTIATLLFAVQTTLRGITQQDRVTLGILAIITALLAAATLIDAAPFLRSVMAPLGIGILDPFGGCHRHQCLSGLYRTGMGKLVVLGHIRKRVAVAMAFKHGLFALSCGYGKDRNP